MSFSFADPASKALPLHVLRPEEVTDFSAKQSGFASAWIAANGFSGGEGEALLVPGEDGTPAFGLLGYGTDAQRARTRFILSKAAVGLPDGTYRLVANLSESEMETEALGWLLSNYAFRKYVTAKQGNRHLIAPDVGDARRIEAIATGEVLTRDLINTPASDMGPANLEQAMRDLADRHKASVTSWVGPDLLTANFPMIHAVGRAAEGSPRLIELRYGSSGPKLTLVGKGVCFDTGGLNIKPGSSMALMKKDMGGAATVLGLAHMIMALKLPIQLRVLIPAVENSISGNAFRPQDILTSRKGLTVEINNTDAEGRLVLADALTYADEDAADLIVSMATLTGAARVAVGPDLAPFYCDDDAAARALANASQDVADPVWRMPFHAPYEPMIEPGIANLDNAPKGGFAGSITAALFLKRFVDRAPYMHFDIYGWQPSAAPARPKGGVGQGARALLQALPALLDL